MLVSPLRILYFDTRVESMLVLLLTILFLVPYISTIVLIIETSWMPVSIIYDYLCIKVNNNSYRKI